MPIPAIILAAGASRRLGSPKQLVLVDGETLLARTMRIAAEAGADPVVVVLGGNQASIQSVIDFSNVHRVVNTGWEQGIATSIRAGIESLETFFPAAIASLLIACDQPNLTSAHLRSLLASYGSGLNRPIVASRYDEVPGIPAIFPKNHFAALRGLEGDIGARHILRSHTSNLVLVDFVGGGFDIDSKADLASLADHRAGIIPDRKV